MAKISINKRVKLSTKEATDLLKKVLDDLSDKYSVNSEWQTETTVNVSHSMMKGNCCIVANTSDSECQNEIQINIKLGMLASAFKSKIEEAIVGELDKYS